MLNRPLKPMLLNPLQPNEIKKNWKSSLKWDGPEIRRILYTYGGPDPEGTRNASFNCSMKRGPRRPLWWTGVSRK